MKYFKVEAQNSTIIEEFVDEFAQIDQIKLQSFMDEQEGACVEMYPHSTESKKSTEELSYYGFIMLIAVISACHIVATLILYYGIGGNYAKGNFTVTLQHFQHKTLVRTQTHEIELTNKEKIKTALKEMLNQIGLKKQVLQI